MKTLPFPRTYWVQERKLVAGCFPGDPDPEQARIKLQGLVNAGVTRVVSLMEEQETDRAGRPFSDYRLVMADLGKAAGRTISFVRCPIVDLSVPSKDGMREILDTIDEEIDAGGVVYVHCLGGRGRTGTVVGCWLIRHGRVKPGEALGRLKALTDHNAAAFQPTPEMAEQRRFVESWAERGAVTGDGRIRGGIIGALVGDALGVPVEFSGRQARDADPVKAMRAFGQWNQPAGTWSDDGALLLCSADGLVDGFDPDRVGKLFVRWEAEGLWSARGEVFDIGGTTSRAIAALRAGVSAEAAGPADEGDNGNGSLMRILPVALRFWREDTETVIGYACRLSQVTHGHIRSQLACAFYCVLAVRLLRGEEPVSAYRAAIEDLRPHIERNAWEARVFGRILSGDLGLAPREKINSGGYVIDTLEAAIWCLLNGDGFEEIVLSAVNLGGDTDTTGSVAGGLAGIVHGVDGIPDAWKNALPKGTDVEQLCARLIRAARERPS